MGQATPEPIAEFMDAVDGLVELYLRAKVEGCEPIGRRVLITGLRYFALGLVFRIVDGAACPTHTWTMGIARRAFHGATSRLETAMGIELEPLRVLAKE